MVNSNVSSSLLRGFSQYSCADSTSPLFRVICGDSDTLAEVFATWGESAFRTMETAALIALCKHENSVIATGGGCVIRAENYDILHESGKVLWLERDLDKLPTEGRPLSMKKDVRTLYREREALYRRFADARVDNNGTIEETVKQIKALFESTEYRRGSV